MTELKGFEEQSGPTRVEGRRARRRPGPQDLARAKRRTRRELGYAAQPYCVIIGGGQGGIALGARLKRLDVPTLIVEKNERPGDSLAQALQVALPARPGLVRPPAVPAVPRPLAGVLAEGQDRRLAGDVRQGHGAELLALHRVHAARAIDEARERVDGDVERDGRDGRAAAQAAGAGDGHVGRCRTCPQIPGAETFRGDAAPFQPASAAARTTRGKKCVVLGSNNSAHDICAALWEHGADVTMIQRSSTHVARSDTLMELALGGLYSEAARRRRASPPTWPT